MTSVPTVSDILALLHEDWLPEKQKQTLKNMIIDTINYTEDFMRKTKGDWK